MFYLSYLSLSQKRFRWKQDVGLIFKKKIIHIKTTNTTEGDKTIFFLKCRKIFLIDPIFTKTMSDIKSKIKIEGASTTFFGHNLNMAKEAPKLYINAMPTYALWIQPSQ